MRRIGGILLLVAAVLATPHVVATLVAPDGRLESHRTLLAIQGFRVLLGLVAIFWLFTASRAAGRDRLILGVGLVLALFFGWARFARGTARPWEKAGLPMKERLALVDAYNPRSADFHVRLADKSLDARIQELGVQHGIGQQYSIACSMIATGHFDKGTQMLEEVRKRGESLPPEKWKSMRTKILRELVGGYMRWGEVDNCVANHNADSCLLPLRGGGIHKIQDRSRKAKDLVLGELAVFPDDLVWRWVLNIVSMTLGEYPDKVPPQWLIPPAVFQDDRQVPRWMDVGPALGLGVMGLAGGSAMEDFDQDGDLDILCSSMGFDDSLKYFDNKGDGTFEEIGDAAGLSDERGGLNLTDADYDNDGYPDVYVLRGAWMDKYGCFPNSLLRNQGDKTFVDVTEQAGILSFHPTQVGAFSDIDADGDLDLFVGNESHDDHSHPSELWDNQGDGTFRQAIRGSGIRLCSFVKGCAFGDYDDDGLPDLFVTRRGDGDSLYHNECRGGAFRFEDVTAAAGLRTDVQSFPTWWFDYDNDGREDIFTAGYSLGFLEDDDGSVDRLQDMPAARLGLPLSMRDGYPHLFRNKGDGTFEDVTHDVRLDRVVSVMGANYGDVDGDGWLDLFVGTGNPDFLALLANRLFRNADGKTFEDVTTSMDVGHLQKGHAISFGDIDGDGDQDCYMVLGGWYKADRFPNALYENPGNGNHWVTLRFEGVQANHFGLGSRVRIGVKTPEGSRTIHRTVSTGGSFGCSSQQLEVGLGDALAVESVEVAWPGSTEYEAHGPLELDRVYRIRQGEPGAAVVPSISFHLRADQPMDHSQMHDMKGSGQ